ncbi:NAD-binding protein [Streptomyces meridianus]|uniref:NAD-binding protein n=1 Tax=Streptomyces meridianus TaxID=2938945 RepID=A0ABT0X207_9ACTN|nr:NAD-binding protein [Streptomyces meridianus]MCM2575943.1 NAD-binding protein [Streptomyces meridianus]
MTTLPSQLPRPVRNGHLVVVGDDALAFRLAEELSGVYGMPVTVLLRSLRRDHGPRIAGLMQERPGRVTVVEAAQPDDDALREAGIADAVALALLLQDDRSNIHAALRARRINPDVRLVLRLFNRKLGRHLEEMLERAVAIRAPHLRSYELDSSTTVLSDADTAAPALVAAAVVGHSKVVQAGGLLLRAKERPLGIDGSRPALCTLALLSDSAADPGGEDTEPAGEGPHLLPDQQAVDRAEGIRGRVVLEAITRGPGQPAPRRTPSRLPLRELFSRRLLATLAVLIALQVLFALLTWRVSGGPPLRAAYMAMLDLLNINDPAIGEGRGRQVLQLLSGLAGMALLPVMFAMVLESLGAFRAASSLRSPPRRLSGHLVLLGLGKVGSRVLERLNELGMDVVCVEQDPEARGVAVARARRIPVVIGDVTEEGVLESANVARSRALLALTSNDSINLEAALYARQIEPRLRVVMRLFDDEFATTVYRAMRDSYPEARTRSRSVSSLAAPAFAGAMMGRQILGAIPVERRVLLFAAVEVGGHPALEGRTVEEAFEPDAWRVLALDLAGPEDRRPDLAAAPEPVHRLRSHPPELEWELHPGYVLQPEDRVVIAATRHGLARLLRQPDGRTASPDPTAP